MASESSVPSYEYIPLRGVAISGAEAGTEVSYAYVGMPNLATDAAYYVEQGMNTIRFPIKWEYITNAKGDAQASVSGHQYLTAVTNSIEDMLDAGITVMLDLHSYMRFAPGQYAGSGNNIANAQDMYNIWKIISGEMHDLAVKYPDKLIFEIANEPNSMATTQVLANNNAGIDAIRDAGLQNLVVIQGNGWSGLHAWTYANQDGLSNAQVFTKDSIIDPANNYAIAVHQYVDWNSSGTSPVGQAPEAFKNYLHMNEFMKWVHDNDMKVILGEFGGSSEANSMANVNYLLDQVEDNPYIEGAGGFLGWTAWVGGHSWAQSNFNYIGPDAQGNPSAQMTNVYLDHLNPIDGDFNIPPVDDEDPIGDPGEGGNNPGHDNDPVLTPSHTFDWKWGARDVIQNFDPSKDALNLQNYWTSYDRISLHDDGQGNTVINLLGVDNRLITLQGVALSELSAANIIGVSGNFSQGVSDDLAKYYSFNWNYGLKTTINDFNPDAGIIELNTFSGKSFSELKIYNDDHGDAVINLLFNNQSITLKDVSASELSADNFLGLKGVYADAAIDIPIDDPVDETPVDDPVDDPVDETPVDDPVDDPVDETPVDEEPPVVNHPTDFQSFTWNWGGRVIVNDFNPATDGIDLQSFWTNFSKFSIHNDGDGNVIIDLLDLNNLTITLANTSVSQLSSENFRGVAGNFDDATLDHALKYYHYSWSYGKNSEIKDFDVDTDVINLSAFNHSFSDLKIYNNAEGDAVINVAYDHQTITLDGVSANELSQDNFLV